MKGHKLVYHQGANCDLLAFECALVDQLVLLVEVGDKFRAIVTPITFRRKHESKENDVCASANHSLEVQADTYSRLSNFSNCGVSNRIWKASQTGGAAVKVLFTSMVPKEKPVPMGWSIYNTRMPH